MRRTQTDAFTLIELLVVISVISILMSILLPSLNKAKESGKSAVCLANIHNLTIAWIAYAADNEDWICSSDTEWVGVQPWDGENPKLRSLNSWVSDGPGMPYNDFCNTETAFRRGVLWPYLEILDIYRCPSEKKDSGRSYAISHAMGSAHNYNLEQNFYSVSEIPMPSQKMVFIDFVPPRRFRDGRISNVGRLGASEPIDTSSKIWDRLVANSCRHNNGTNMSFVDGRAEHWKWKDTRTIKVMNGEIGKDDYKEASIDNPDITRLLPAIRGVRDKRF
jgi:prepilin-type N-terminal cleavage/methylation domain-containing protein/prepilin-type processing-associated H-X9-DG protein